MNDTHTYVSESGGEVMILSVVAPLRPFSGSLSDFVGRKGLRAIPTPVPPLIAVVGL